VGGSNGFVYFGLGGTAYRMIRLYAYDEGHRTIQLRQGLKGIHEH